MKKLLYTLGGLLLGITLSAQAASILFPYQGGTGTSTVPSTGQVLVGQSGGNYAPQATSTLGLVSFTYASSTFLTFLYASSTFASTSWITSTFPSFTYASSTFSTYAYGTSTFPSFTYATNTYATIASYPTYTYASATFPSFSYATNTFVTYAYGSSTHPSFTYATATYATIANYPTYTYASSTFASTSWVLSTFPSFTYASGTFPSFTYATATFATIANYPTYTYATATYVGIINNQTIAGNKTFTGTSTFATTTTNGSSTFVGQMYLGNASSSAGITATNFYGTLKGNADTVTTNANLSGVITSSGNVTSIASQTGTGSKFVVDTSPTLITPILGIASSTALSISGNLWVTGASAFATTTTNGSSTFVGQAYFGNASSTGFTATNLYSTNIFPAGLTSSFLAVDQNGKIIATTSPSGGVSGGTTGFLARFTSATAVAAGIFMDNNTVGGIGATSSTVLFNVRGTSGSLNTIFNVASSSNNPILSVSSDSKVGIGTTTPFVQLHIFSTNASGVDPTILLGGNVAGDTDFWIGRPNNNDSVDNDYFGIGKWTGATIATSTQYLSIDKDGNTSIGSTTPAAKFSILATSGASIPTFQVATSTGVSLFNVLANGNVGVGSSTPGSLFSVGSSLAVSPTAPGTNILDVASSTGSIFFAVSQNGHIITGGNTASVSLCGTSPSVSGNDRKGKITTGTGAPTNCTITFNQAYVSAPVCVISTSSAIANAVASTTTTGFSMTFGSGLTSGTVYYICEE
jgi:hypothetical protein